MNYSDDSPKPHSGFKDVEFRDDNVSPIPGGIMPQNIPQQPMAMNSPAYERLENIEMHSRIVKWTSLVLSIFSFLYLLPGAIPLIGTFVFPIIGFIAAHKYSDCLTKFYSVYLVLVTIAQIILMAIIGGVAYIVFQTLVMAAQFVILFFNVKLTKQINGLTSSEKSILLGSQARNFS